MRTTRPVTLLTLAAATALLASACTGSSGTDAKDDPNKEVTITFWHGWTAKNEVKAINDNIARFEKAHPNIHVKAVGNITDDKINQALRAGGPKAPDVVSSFTTDNVGKFCASNAFADLKPFLAKSKIDPATTFPKPMQEYTQFEGKRCTLPLLGDAYGLYYDKDAFKKAGIKAPPKTMSEFKKAAVKLTKSKGDTYSQLGFMPNFHGYESTPIHLGAQWDPRYFDADGKSNLAKDPGIAAMFDWQQDMVKSLGGYQKLEKYRSTFGDEFAAKNPFHTGQVAMAIDGEWRLGMAREANPELKIGVAPMPVPDDQADKYGRGYLAGTIVGIANTSPRKNAAWELLKFMTTDTKAVVDFANAIHNVPSTMAALKSPDLDDDPDFRTFVKIAENPDSVTAPTTANGGAFQVSLQNFGYRYEAGKAPALKAGLVKTDKEIDAAIEQAK
ncbi:ABC transporter substrate-binding protein [Streptomyces boninensis]|uniref:ABC transporter substrate-binding protein n=1 Tax=Streptomyces boninensis TaxID=2039455 RepID=UPI003B223539